MPDEEITEGGASSPAVNGDGVHAEDGAAQRLLLNELLGVLKEKRIKRAPGFDEARKAAELRGKGKALHGVRCVGREWYAYHAGFWENVERARFGPAVLEALAPDFRTARNAGSVLDHVEMAAQVAPAELRGFYGERLDEDGERSFLVNVRNGVLEIFPEEGSWSLRKHSEGHGFTLQAVAAYEEEAQCPRFMELLGEQLPDGADRELVQLFAGSLLCPTAQFESALVAYGPGGLGKSKLALAIANTLSSEREGSDLVSNLSLAQLCDSKGYSLPKLRAAALNVGTELQTVDLDDSSNFKALISGERVEARSIYGKPFSMRSTTKHWFLTNDPPRFKNGSSGEGRRLRFLKFEVEPKRRDVRLLEKLCAEREGIFRWMVEGLLKLMAAGEMPQGGAASRSVWEKFEMANDSVSWFVEHFCVLDAQASWRKEQALYAFEQFLEDEGFSTRHAGDWFFKRLYQKFSGRVSQVRRWEDSKQVRYLTGIRLAET